MAAAKRPPGKAHDTAQNNHPTETTDAIGTNDAEGARDTVADYDAEDTKKGGPNGEPLDLRVTVWFVNVTELDNVAQTFKAEIEITVITRDATRADISKHFFKSGPAIRVRNAVNFERIRGTDKDGHQLDDGRILWSLRARGTFSEPFKLANFPIDVQELGIEVVSDRCPLLKGEQAKRKRCLRFYFEHEDKTWPPVLVSEKSITIAQSYMRLQGRTAYLTTTFAHESKRSNVYSVVCGCIVLQRKPHFFVQNLIVPSFVSTLLAMTSFFVSHNDLDDRLGLTFTMLLTAAAYKIVAASRLPPISKLTFLDRQIHGCSAFACLVAVQNVLGSIFPGIDHIFAWLVFLLFVAFCAYAIGEWWRIFQDNATLRLRRVPNIRESVDALVRINDCTFRSTEQPNDEADENAQIDLLPPGKVCTWCDSGKGPSKVDNHAHFEDVPYCYKSNTPSLPIDRP